MRSFRRLLVFSCESGRAPPARSSLQGCISAFAQGIRGSGAIRAVPTPPDPAVLYADVAVCGSLAAALRAVAGGCLDAVPARSSDLVHAVVPSTVPHRGPLAISAWFWERRWSIQGTEPFRSLPLIDGTTDDLAEIARAARAWHEGAALDDIRRAAPFVHVTGRLEVPDHDPARLTESEWQGLRPADGRNGVRLAAEVPGPDRGGVRRAGPARLLPFHQPLGAALFDRNPPGPDGCRTVPGRERRWHVRSGQGASSARVWASSPPPRRLWRWTCTTCLPVWLPSPLADEPAQRLSRAPLLSSHCAAGVAESLHASTRREVSGGAGYRRFSRWGCRGR